MSSATPQYCQRCGERLGGRTAVVGGWTYHPQCTPVIKAHEVAALEAENAELRRERDKGCCANCATCTPVGFCTHPEALASVKTNYPMQSDFRCRYWSARLAAPSPDAKEA